MHCHHSKSYLSHITEDFFGIEFLASILVQSNFLIKTAAIRIFHDNINAIVLNERFNELNESGSQKNSEELDLVFGTLLVLLIKIREVNSFQSIFFTIELISDEINRARGTLTEWPYIFILK